MLVRIEKNNYERQRPKSEDLLKFDYAQRFNLPSLNVFYENSRNLHLIISYFQALGVIKTPSNHIRLILILNKQILDNN